MRQKNKLDFGDKSYLEKGVLVFFGGCLSIYQALFLSNQNQFNLNELLRLRFKGMIFSITFLSHNDDKETFQGTCGFTRIAKILTDVNFSVRSSNNI